MSPKEKAKEIYHDCLNIGAGYISNHLAGLYAINVVTFVISESSSTSTIVYYKQVKAELRKILHLK